MKKYLSIACVFLLGNEVLSWIAAAVIAWMAIVDFAKEVDREASRTRFNYMEDFGSITPLDAVKDLGIMCLAERIRDLRKLGIKIDSTPESGKNRYGKTVRWTRYTLCG